MKRELFSIHEHLTAGEIIRRIKDDVSFLAMAVETAYGRKVSNSLFTALKYVERTQSKLDDCVCGEFPMSIEKVEGFNLTNVYYGERSDIRNRRGAMSSDEARVKLRHLAGIETVQGPSRDRGRPKAIDAERLAQAKTLLATTNSSVEDIARQLGLAASTLYRYLKNEAASVSA